MGSFPNDDDDDENRKPISNDQRSINNQFINSIILISYVKSNPKLLPISKSAPLKGVVSFQALCSSHNLCVPKLNIIIFNEHYDDLASVTYIASNSCIRCIVVSSDELLRPLLIYAAKSIRLPRFDHDKQYCYIFKKRKKQRKHYQKKKREKQERKPCPPPPPPLPKPKNPPSPPPPSTPTTASAPPSSSALLTQSPTSQPAPHPRATKPASSPSRRSNLLLKNVAPLQNYHHHHYL